MKEEPCFSKDFAGKKFSRRIMRQLLSKESETRRGGSFAALKANEWFDDFDWDRLYNKELKSPYRPESEKMITAKEIFD
jgi:cGMP-dependent protein kinase